MQNYLLTLLLISSLSPSVISAAEKASSKVPSVSNSVASVAIALVFIIFVILACAWMLRRMGGGTFQKTGAIEVKASHMLGTKERLLIVKVDGRHLLLGVTQQSISKLDELSDNCLPLEKSEPVTFQQAFSEQFKKMMGRNNEKH